MKPKYYALILLMAVIVAVAGVVVYRGTAQTVIGSSQTQAQCESYLKSQWCSGGLYSCTPCQKVTLPYSLKFDNGVTTNIVYNADCVYGSNTANGHTFCQQASAITSHVGYWCYDNDLYYYNSAGTREEKKEECSNGCTSTYKGGNTKISCDSAPKTCYICYNNVLSTKTTTTTCPSGYSTTKPTSCGTVSIPTQPTTSPICMPNTVNQLCKSPTLVSGQYYCDIDQVVYCPAGCSNGACKTSTCSNDAGAVQVGVTECTSPTAFKRASLGSDGCIHWGSPQFCPSTTPTCEKGACVKTPTTPAPTMPKCLDTTFLCTANPQMYNGELVGCDGNQCQYGCTLNKCNSAPSTTPKTCTPSTVCSSSSKVKLTNADCTTKYTTCGSGETCTEGMCVQSAKPEPVTDLCKDVVCNDFCDDKYTFNEQGSCESTTGKCVYQMIFTNSDACLPKPADNQTLPITGDVTIDVPDRTEKTWFDTYGLWIGGGLIIALIGLYISMDAKDRKKRRK